MTNQWILRSLNLASRPGYLDKLFSSAYPLQINPPRQLDSDQLAEIRAAHRERHGRRLLSLLFDLERFPLKYPFAALMKENPELVRRNPKVADYLARSLLRMDANSLIRECRRAKEANTQAGPMFQEYLSTLRFPVVQVGDLSSHRGTAIATGSDKELRKFADVELGCALQKGLDLLFKAAGRYYIGEAKFLGAAGGSQNRRFDEAVEFLGGHRGSATRVAILDGCMWLDGASGRMEKELRKLESVAMSALLLSKFIQTVS